jgi:hypothetical protein
MRIAVGAQGFYYLVTGAWPLVSMENFELVTGPKIEHWLVHTVSLLVLGIGASLLVAARSAQVGASVSVLALCVATAFASIDLYYAGIGRISPVYLLDAAVELGFVLWLVIALARRKMTKAVAQPPAR